MNHVAAPENAGAEDVVARRELQLDGRDVTLVVGAAQAFDADETDVFCPVRLEESDGTEIWSSRAGGVDSVQALLLALTAAGHRLAQHDGEVTFLGGRELSLPLITGSTGRRTVATFAHGTDDLDDVPVASASLQA